MAPNIYLILIICHAYTAAGPAKITMAIFEEKGNSWCHVDTELWQYQQNFLSLDQSQAKLFEEGETKLVLLPLGIEIFS